MAALLHMGQMLNSLPFLGWCDLLNEMGSINVKVPIVD